MFGEYKLSPILFTANGGGFLFDDCYVLAERGRDLVKWGEVLAARRDELIDALRKAEIESLFLDSPRPDAESRSDSRARVSVSSTFWDLYIGVDEELAPDPAALLRRAYGMAKGLFDVRYGIGYKSPLAQDPDCYASGNAPSTLSDVLEMIRLR